MLLKKAHEYGMRFEKLEPVWIWSAIGESMQAAEIFPFTTYFEDHPDEVVCVRNELKNALGVTLPDNNYIWVATGSELPVVAGVLRDALRGVEGWELPFRVGARREEIQGLLARVEKAIGDNDHW
jgi:hypothetical protein